MQEENEMLIVSLLLLGTSIWVLVDGYKFKMGKNEHPVLWFLGCLLLWIVVFPMYLIKRSHYGLLTVEEKRWGHRKMTTATKVSIGVCAGVIVLIILAMVFSEDSSNIQKVTNPAKQDNSTNATTNTPAKEKLTISKSVAKDKGYGLWEVVGEVVNNDSVKHTAMLKATFYSDNGQIMGTATGFVNDVAPGETKTFNLISTDSLSGYKEMKVQVDTLL